MHGMVFAELQKYVKTKLGADAWDKLLKESKSPTTIFMITQAYPDEQIVSLVAAASKITGTPAAQILEDFGAFIVPDLIKMYHSVIKPNWKTLDLIEHTEQAIHTVVRIKAPGAKPPELKVKRTSPKEVVIEYTSKRKLCAFAKGLVKGISAVYKEKVTIDEPSCMHNGKAACTIKVQQN